MCFFCFFSGQPMQTSEFFLVGENTGHGNECGMGMGWVWDGYGMGMGMGWVWYGYGMGMGMKWIYNGY